MIEKIRSLVWVDYCLALFTDFSRLGTLLSRHAFIPVSLIFPVIAALTDIAALYTAVGRTAGHQIGLSYGTITLALIYIIHSWIGGSLMTTALNADRQETSLLRNFTIINMSFVFKLFVLPCVSIAAVISLAPVAILVLAEVAAYIVGIVSISWCLAAVQGISPGKSLLMVIVPRMILQTVFVLICIIAAICLFQYLMI